MHSEKIEQAVDILKEKDIDMWLIFARESKMIPEPSMKLVVGVHCTWQSAYIITAGGDKIAIVGNLDAEETRGSSSFSEVIGYKESIKEPLIKAINKHKPKKIAVNFSKDSPAADGLTHGMYINLVNYLKDTPYTSRFISSEDLISALRGRKSDTEIKKIKNAIRLTLNIFNTFDDNLKIGMTEKEAAQILIEEMQKKNVEPAWDINYCPSVFTGPQEFGAHSGPTDKKIEKGHLMNIDFGIKLDDYCSDLQRTWYFKKDDEDDAPEIVKKAFDTVRDAIRKSAEFLKPGVKGKDVDKTARDYIISQGFEEYPHALGHQIGREAHDGGGLLCPEWDRYGNLPYKEVEENQVYTLEPRINLPKYGVATIEEIVQVKKDGVEFLSEPQTEIYLK